MPNRPVALLSGLLCLALSPAYAQSFPSNPPLSPSRSLESGVQPDSWVATLRTKAAQIRQTAGAPVFGPAPDRPLKLGDSGEDVQWLVNALIAKHYLASNPAFESLSSDHGFSTPAPPTLTEFLPEVEMAVRNLQQASHLDPDGVAGPRVYSALLQDDVRVGNALDRLASNVEQWSNQARSQGYDRMIVVNIPSYTLHAIDLTSGQEALTSRVVVGNPRTQTPLMVTRIVNLKANPDWTPPKSIRHAHHQRPGPNSALGLMRFSTDNHFNIYLHDTNARGLFARDTRALSHGCVRVQEWHALAAWSARQDDAWVDEVALAGGRTRYLSIDAIPVVITYSRADLVDDQAQAYPDIYDQGAEAIGAAELDGRMDVSVHSLEFAP